MVCLAIAANRRLTRTGNIATKTPIVRGLRTIKKEILKLVNIFVERSDDPQMLYNDIVPKLLEAVLIDYKRNVPDAREAEVLHMMSTLIARLSVSCSASQVVLSDDVQGMMEVHVMHIMESVFECTLEMINKDFSDYPEHRVQFFNLLKTINTHCFASLLKLDTRAFKFVIDSCMWASKHDNREVESTGLTMCVEMVCQMADADPQTRDAFFQNFYVIILQDLFFVLTDSDHKAGFKYQSMLLAKMVWLVDTDRVQSPIYSADMAPAGTPNREFVRNFIGRLLTNAFPNLQP